MTGTGQTIPGIATRKSLAELMRRGWTDDDIGKLAGENLLRVMSAAEHFGARIRGEPMYLPR
jgi:membrane dipeptidase